MLEAGIGHGNNSEENHRTSIAATHRSAAWLLDDSRLFWLLVFYVFCFFLPSLAVVASCSIEGVLIRFFCRFIVGSNIR